MQKKKLLFVINQASFFVSNRLQLALTAQANGFEIHLACPAAEECEQLSKNYNFIHHPLVLSRKGMHIWQEFKTIIALVKLYKNLKPDIVHHLTIKPIIYGGIASKITKMPSVVFALTGLGYVIIDRGMKASLLRLLVKRLYSFSLKNKNSITIFQNQDDKDLFINWKIVSEDKAILIKSSGVDVNHFCLLPQTKNNIVTIILPARMLRDKGVYEFIAAARIIKQKERAHFILVGGIDADNPAAISEQEINNWVKDGVIEWLGFQKHMLDILRIADIVCLPSYREGVPKALLEAAACGKPIVTTSAPGCKEVVMDGWNGFLVPVRDEHALAQALIKLIQNQSLREQFGSHSRQIVLDEFSLEKVNQTTIEVYKKLLN